MKVSKEKKKNYLAKRVNPKVETQFLMKLLEIILTENIFEFHNQLWKQKIGAAMGSRPVPHYANNLMAEIDDKIEALAVKYNKNNIEALRLLKSFLDDYFSLFVGTTRDLHKLLDYINKINPTIQQKEILKRGMTWTEQKPKGTTFQVQFIAIANLFYIELIHQW